MARYRYTNYGLAEHFVAGGIKGCSNRGSIDGDKLYSYSKCIAVRKETGAEQKLLISNRAGFLGGRCHSMTTSRHISDVYFACRNAHRLGLIVKYTLVSGWADGNNGNPHKFEYVTHKTTYGVIRSFLIGNWANSNEPRGWHHQFDKLFSPENELVATRECKTGSKHCIRNCDTCPAKFECKTSGDGYYGYVFNIANGKHANLVKKYLHPFALVEDLTQAQA